MALVTDVPHDPRAERAVIGAAVSRPDLVDELAVLVRPEDFHGHRAKALFGAVLDLHEKGQRWDERVLLNACAAAGTPVEAVDLIEATAAYSGAWRSHAERVSELRARRDLLRVAGELVEQVDQGSVDAATIADAAGRRLATLDLPGSHVPASLSTLDAIADRAADHAPWVVPGLLRSGWRAVVVGLEGSGKSVLARQFTVCTAAGIHPLHYKPIPPMVTLLVDLENPADVVTAGVRQLRDTARTSSSTFDPTLSWVWEQPGGIDLRSRKHRAELDAICSTIRPDLVCLGPLYKAYRTQARENDEQAVADVQHVLDDLRTRHGFALLLEHHAPHDASNGAMSGRKLRPYGSSLWLRWPEFGIGLQPDEKQPKRVLHLKRWRGDRIQASWPDRIEYGTTWPWAGIWKDDPTP